jgi:predicted phosphodiesterase
MRIAVIADIHGNSAALDAVLADIATQGADLTVNLGDSVSGPLDAAGCAERLVGAGFPTVAGNHDRWLVERAPEEMGAWERPAFPRLSETHLAWLGSLPLLLRVEGLLLCHGTPASVTEPWLDVPVPGGGLGLAPRSRIEAAAAGIAAEGFLCAHTHVARALRLADGRLVVNPGSVGCPAYADRRPASRLFVSSGAADARYALVERKDGRWRATHRAVPYDASAMIELARAAGEADWVSALSSGWVTP